MKVTISQCGSNFQWRTIDYLSVVWKTYVTAANGKLHLTWTLENSAVCILGNTCKSHISHIIISNKFMQLSIIS